MKPTARRPGFTLAELLISMALMAMIMAAAAMAIHAASMAHGYNAAKTDIVAKARGVVDRISQDIRVAVSFDVPDGRTLNVTMPNGTIHSYVWDGAVDGNLTYVLTDGETVTSAVLTDDVQAFSVSDDSPACTVSIALENTKAAAAATMTAMSRKAMF
jgi:prepilin-type N-terminal cleavage/methylation domain-containing protein